jgi:hypothetical protein
MQVVRRWFNRLRWKARQEGPNTPSNTVTLLECVVDFELFTGHCLGSIKGETLTWAQKASRLAYYLKALVRTHTVAWNGIETTYKHALRPTTDATSITPLGGPLMSGFGRRPVWTDARTPKVAAINVWRAKQEHISQKGRSGIAERRSRKFVHNWNLSMKGHRSKPPDTPSMNKLKQSIRKQSNIRSTGIDDNETKNKPSDKRKAKEDRSKEPPNAKARQSDQTEGKGSSASRHRSKEPLEPSNDQRAERAEHNQESTSTQGSKGRKESPTPSTGRMPPQGGAPRTKTTMKRARKEITKRA